MEFSWSMEKEESACWASLCHPSLCVFLSWVQRNEDCHITPNFVCQNKNALTCRWLMSALFIHHHKKSSPVMCYNLCNQTAKSLFPSLHSHKRKVNANYMFVIGKLVRENGILRISVIHRDREKSS